MGYGPKGHKESDMTAATQHAHMQWKAYDKKLGVHANKESKCLEDVPDAGVQDWYSFYNNHE